jgi:hypothetical protein
MRYSTVLIGLLASCLIPVLAAPTSSPAGPKPTAYNHGDIVGVRASKIEAKDSSVRSYKDIDIHPAVVVAGPDAKGQYQVATISKKHLHDPPQADISNFHSDLQGKVKLVATDPINVDNMKPWKSGTTGITTEPMGQEGLAKLHEAMTPHVGWKPPVQPEVASSSTPAAQSGRKRAGNRAIPGQVHAGGSGHPPTAGSNKHLPGSHSQPHIPAGKKGQHVNAHAGGSKHPQIHNPAPASHANLKKAPHPNAHVTPSRHGAASGSKVRTASRPKVAKVNNKVKQPVVNRGASRNRKGPGVKRSLRSW